MKIDRLIGILTILLQKPKVTARYLADRFEVSLRTINRDVETLCMAGIPIITEQGRNGGISIMEGYKIDASVFTSKEMQAILTGLKSLDSVSGSNQYQLLMQKLSKKQEEIASPGSVIRINLASWNKPSLAPKFEQIKNAIENKQMVKFLYFSPSGESERTVEPYLLVFQWSTWYVWGYCLLRKEFRLFKLNRMRELKVTKNRREERVVPDFSMDANPSYKNDGVTFTAEFDQSMKWRVVEELGIAPVEVTKGGTFLLELGWSDKESLFSWLLGFRNMVTLVKPKELSIEFANLLKKMEENYK